MATGTQLEKSAPATADNALAGGLSMLWVRARVWWASMAAGQRIWAIVSLFLLAFVVGAMLVGGAVLHG